MLTPTSTLSPGQYLYFVLLFKYFFFTFFSLRLAGTFCFPNINHAQEGLVLVSPFHWEESMRAGSVKMLP